MCLLGRWRESRKAIPPAASATAAPPKIHAHLEGKEETVSIEVAMLLIIRSKKIHATMHSFLFISFLPHTFPF
jgi:hypothetical protein